MAAICVAFLGNAAPAYADGATAIDIGDQMHQFALNQTGSANASAMGGTDQAFLNAGKTAIGGCGGLLTGLSFANFAKCGVGATESYIYGTDMTPSTTTQAIENTGSIALGAAGLPSCLGIETIVAIAPCLGAINSIKSGAEGLGDQLAEAIRPTPAPSMEPLSQDEIDRSQDYTSGKSPFNGNYCSGGDVMTSLGDCLSPALAAAQDATYDPNNSADVAKYGQYMPDNNAGTDNGATDALNDGTGSDSIGNAGSDNGATDALNDGTGGNTIGNGGSDDGFNSDGKKQSQKQQDCDNSSSNPQCQNSADSIGMRDALLMGGTIMGNAGSDNGATAALSDGIGGNTIGTTGSGL